MPNLNSSSFVQAVLQVVNNANPASTIYTAPFFAITGGRTVEEVISLAAGFNSIGVPTGCNNGVVIVFSATAGTGTPAIPFNLKGITGDTGLPAGLGTFQVISWTGATVPAAIGITNNYSSAVPVTLFFF